MSKIVVGTVETASGVPVEFPDGIDLPSGAAFGLDTLSASNGAVLVGSIAAGSGAIPRNTQDKMREIVSVYDRMTDLQRIDSAVTRGGAITLTVPLQTAIDDAIVRGVSLRDTLGGVLTTRQLNFNGSNSVPVANTQTGALISFEGAGRFASTIFNAASGYSPGECVIKGRNMSGVHYRNFSVNGRGIADSGIDFSWVGGSEGNSTLAPSNNNILENVSVEGCSALGINLNQFHDSKISGLWIRGVGAEGTALSLIGGGGQLVMDNVWCSSGIFRVSCQNAGISNCGFFGGVELTGAGFNNITWSGVHFFARTSNGVALSNTSYGNATRGNNFMGCYFNDCTYVTNGLWHQGAKFTSCQFNAWTSFADSANFYSAGGVGQVPLFIFENCSFAGTTPVSVAGKFNVRIIGCKSSVGTVLDDHGNLYASGAVNFSAESQIFGKGNVRSAQNLSLAEGGTLTIPMVTGTWLLTIMASQASANIRTSSTYQVAGWQGDGFAATLLATNVGSSPTTIPITVTWSANNIVITNNSTATVSMKAAMFGVA